MNTPAASNSRLRNDVFERLCNFRDLGGFTTKDGKRVREGLLFRSARPDDATEGDVRKLREQFHVDTLLDVRSRGEVDDEHLPQRPVYVSYPTETLILQRWRLDSVLGHPAYESRPRRYHLPFMGPTFHLDMVRQQPNKWGFFKTVARGVDQAQDMVVQEVMNAKGMPVFYQTLLRTCAHQLASALKILAADDHQSVLFHCSHGKDRTGLIAALCLACLGVADDDIASDYALSEPGLEPIAEQTRQELVVAKGLTEEFALANPEAILKALAYVRQDYGSVEAYLDHAGFGPEWVVALKSKMLV